MTWVDFAEIKKRVGIREAADWLGLKYTESDGGLRLQCPHNKGQKNEISITPNEGKFRCHGCAGKPGGDAIALVAHIKNIRQREAALMLQEAFLNDPPAPEPEPEEQPARGMSPLRHLNYEHESLGKLKEIAEAVGVGFASKGLMQKRIAIPLRLADGTLVGYLGIPPGTDIKTPDAWHT